MSAVKKALPMLLIATAVLGAAVARSVATALATPEPHSAPATKMAPFDAAESVLRNVFAGARAVRTKLQEAGHPAPWLSMGMSGDFELAVEEGATHVRLGTILFGSR